MITVKMRTTPSPRLDALLAAANPQPTSPTRFPRWLRLAVPGEATIVFVGFLLLLAFSSHPLW